MDSSSRFFEPYSGGLTRACEAPRVRIVEEQAWLMNWLKRPRQPTRQKLDSFSKPAVPEVGARAHPEGLEAVFRGLEAQSLQRNMMSIRVQRPVKESSPTFMGKEVSDPQSTHCFLHRQVLLNNVPRQDDQPHAMKSAQSWVVLAWNQY